MLVALCACLSLPALAQRHVWLVPGTQGEPFEGLGWDRAAGRIIAGSGDAILGIDPVTGEREALHRTEGPKVLDLVVGPEGVDFLQEGPVPGQSDGRIRRLTADGVVRVIAGRGDEGPFEGAAEDALEARFSPAHLAAGPDGGRYVSDFEHNRVLVLEPTGAGFRSRVFAGAEREGDRGYDADAADLTGDGEQPLESAFLDSEWDPDPNPLRVELKPRGLAVLPDGGVYLADWSDQGRPPLVLQVDRSGVGGRWECWRLPMPGVGHSQCPPGQEKLPVRKPRLLAAGDDGTLHILGSSHIWSYTRLDVDEKGEAYAYETWRREAVAGPLAPSERTPAWPPPGAPADQLDPAVLARVRHLAVLPGGCLLLSDGADGIRCIGPAQDGVLGARVREHGRILEQARTAAGPGARARELARAEAVPAGLERQRDHWRSKGFDLAFRPLCKAATLAPRLPEDLLEHIASFLVHDPRILACRAVMAAQALRAGAGPGPSPEERRLAQRHLWPVTTGLDVDALHWDAEDGSLVLASGLEIRRVNPARGPSSVLLASPAAAPAGRVHSLVAGPGGLIDFTLGGEGADPDLASGIWRLGRDGTVRQLATDASALATPTGPLARSGHPLDLAAGPGGAHYALDAEHRRVLRLTAEAVADRFDCRTVHQDLGFAPERLMVGAKGELVVNALNARNQIFRLEAEAGGAEPDWSLDWIPWRGSAGCAQVYVPAEGNQVRAAGAIHGLVPDRNDGFFVAEDHHLLEYVPRPEASGLMGWHCRLVTVSAQHAMPGGYFDPCGGAESTLPVPLRREGASRALAGIPGGALAMVLAPPGRSPAVAFVGPIGDGELFQRIRGFREAVTAGQLGKAKRILKELIRQGRLTEPEVCDLPFLPLGRRGAWDAAPRLRSLSRPLQRRVGSFLVRPTVVPFRAGLAVQALLAESPWIRPWVDAGCPADEIPAAAAPAPGRAGALVGLVPVPAAAGPAAQAMDDPAPGPRSAAVPFPAVLAAVPGGDLPPAPGPEDWARRGCCRPCPPCGACLITCTDACTDACDLDKAHECCMILHLPGMAMICVRLCSLTIGCCAGSPSARDICCEGWEGVCCCCICCVRCCVDGCCAPGEAPR